MPTVQCYLSVCLSVHLYTNYAYVQQHRLALWQHYTACYSYMGLSKMYRGMYMYIYMDMYLYMYRTRRHYSSSLWGCSGRQCVAVGSCTRRRREVPPPPPPPPCPCPGRLCVYVDRDEAPRLLRVSLEAPRRRNSLCFARGSGSGACRATPPGTARFRLQAHRRLCPTGDAERGWRHASAEWGRPYCHRHHRRRHSPRHIFGALFDYHLH